MKKVLGLLLMLALVALSAFAGEESATVKPAATDVQMGTLMHAMDNVTVIKEGHKTALCGCGKEFEVSDKTPKMDANGMTMYCCTPECHEHAMAMKPEEMAAGMMEWQKMFSAKEMASNVMMVDGKKMATCACGQKFEMTDKTCCVVENGMKVNTCCNGCAEHMMKASAEERMGMMQKAMYTTEKK